MSKKLTPEEDAIMERALRRSAKPMSDEIDSKCLGLARHFLKDGRNVTERDERNLAEAIQKAVEEWFEMQECADDARG